VRTFTGLGLRHSLRLEHSRLGARFDLGSRGQFALFRETIRTDGIDAAPVVLVVGFRLRWIGSFPPAHWVFQRCCILTTPFWSGFPGFRVKLWLVDPTTNDYLGIYDWDGHDSAQTYVDALVRVLKPLSETGSVWYELMERELPAFLAEHHAAAAAG
jgi:hypothetical protein